MLSISRFHATLLCGLLLTIAPVTTRSNTETGEADFEAALSAALADEAVPLAAQIECTEEHGPRSMALFPSGALIWGGERQARITGTERSALLRALLDADFAHFEGRYGGKLESEESDAPIMVLCRIAVRVGGAEKSSYQDLNGERSTAFLALAAQLLDQVEPLGAQGVTAASLGDGIDKLTTGELAPEALSLHVLWIPVDRAEMGVILELAGGQVSRHNYRPGVAVGDSQTHALSTATLQSLLGTLAAADLPSLPDRLPAPDTYRLRVQVLQHVRTIQARPAGPPGPETARLVRLVEALMERL